MEKPIFIPKLRLVFQGSINIASNTEGVEEYNDLKIHLKNIDKNCTLNGQVMMILEPCCKKPIIGAKNEENTKVHQ